MNDQPKKKLETPNFHIPNLVETFDWLQKEMRYNLN